MKNYLEAFDFSNDEKPIKSVIELLSLEQLFLKPNRPMSWIVDGLCIESGVSIICGKPKSGKSTLARQMILSVANGYDFLERPCDKSTVLYYALEEIEDEVSRGFRQLGAEGSEKIYVHVGPIKNSKSHLKQAIEKYQPKLVVIDPLFRFLKVKDLNDYSEVTHQMEELSLIARSSKAHLCLLHHTNKASDSTNGILGSTAIFGAVDGVLILRRTVENSFLSTRMRYGEDMSEAVLEFDYSTNMYSLGITKQDLDVEKAKTLILVYLQRAMVHGVTEAELSAEVFGVSTTGKRHALRCLVNERRVKRSGKGGKSDPYRYSSI